MHTEQVSAAAATCDALPAVLRPAHRYQPPNSHEGFVEGLLLEGRLRLRIAELQAHRAAGRRTLADVSGAGRCTLCGSHRQ